MKSTAVLQWGSIAPNLIVVIGESVSTRRTGFYGYKRQTTPRLAALRAARSTDWVQLERVVANASATKVALPAMLSGFFRRASLSNSTPFPYYGTTPLRPAIRPR